MFLSCWLVGLVMLHCTRGLVPCCFWVFGFGSSVHWWCWSVVLVDLLLLFLLMVGVLL